MCVSIPRAAAHCSHRCSSVTTPSALDLRQRAPPHRALCSSSHSIRPRPLARPSREAARRPTSKHPVRPRGQRPVVGHDDHPNLEVPHQLTNSSCSRSALTWSRLPDGSSASTTAGSMASARATAVRCCSPPDNSAGRCVHATAQARPAPAVPRRAAARLALAPPADPQRHHHVLERGELPQQMVELEDEADGPVAERASASSVSAAHRLRRRSPHIRASGRSRAPSTCSSVLFPAPLAPTIGDHLAAHAPRGPRRRGRSSSAAVAAPVRLRVRSTRTTTASLILVTDRVERIESRRLHRRIQRRERRDHETRHDDERRHPAAASHRQMVDEIDLRDRA